MVNFKILEFGNDVTIVMGKTRVEVIQGFRHIDISKKDFEEIIEKWEEFRGEIDYSS